MKNFYSILILFSLSQVLLGQNNKTLLNDDFYSSESRKILTSDAAFFKYMMNNEFSKMVTGNSFTGIGQYASISTEGDNLEASLNFITNCGVLDLKLKGGSTDGITNFFSENRLNSSVGVESAYHFKLSRKDTDYFTVNVADLRRVQDKERELNEAYKIDNIKLVAKNATLNEELKKKRLEKEKKILQKKDSNEEIEVRKNILLAEIALLEAKRDYYSNENNIKIELNKLINKRDVADNTDVFKRSTFLVDSLKLYRKASESILELETKKNEFSALENINLLESQEFIELQIAILDGEISSIKRQMAFHSAKMSRLKMQLRNDYIDKIRENRKKVFDIKALDVKLSWLTIGAGGTYNSYDFFDRTRIESKQFFQNNDLTWNFKLAYSSYENTVNNKSKFNKRNIRFNSFGIIGNITNNINKIGEVEVRTIEELSSTREVLSKKEAYQGDFKDGIFTGLLFYDRYRFFGNRDNVGVHYRGTFEFGDIKPITSIRLGLVFPFKNLKENGSFLNLEVFAGLNNIFNTNDKPESLFSRNIIGVQATVPFNFKIL